MKDSLIIYFWLAMQNQEPEWNRKNSLNIIIDNWTFNSQLAAQGIHITLIYHDDLAYTHSMTQVVIVLGQ